MTSVTRRRSRRLALACVALIGALLAAQAALMVIYFRDNAFLRGLVSDRVSGQETPSKLVIKFTEFVREEVPRKSVQKPFLADVFMPLRPPPKNVALLGGDCADKSRLLISLLRLYGVDSSKVALYDDQAVPRHAVVVAEIENGQEMVVDALYGMYFPKSSGGFHTVEDITADESILRQRLAALQAEGSDGYHPPIERYPLERYTYRQPRSINWDKSAISRQLYRALHVLFGDSVDDFERPFWVERPALMLILACAGTQVVLLFVLLLGARYNRSVDRGLTTV